MGSVASGEVGSGSGLRLYLLRYPTNGGGEHPFCQRQRSFDSNAHCAGDCHLLRHRPKGKLAYLFTAGLIADTAAMPLITSNPINILSADYFKYSFIDHLIFMGPVAVAVLLSSLLLIWLFFRKQIPKTYDVQAAEVLNKGKPAISPTLLKISLVTLVAIDVGYVLTSLNRFPVSLVICSGAVFLVVVYWFTLEAEWFGERREERAGWLGEGYQLGHCAVYAQHIHSCSRIGDGWRHELVGFCTYHNQQISVGAGSFCAKHGCNSWSQLHEQLAHDNPWLAKHPASSRNWTQP